MSLARRIVSYTRWGVEVRLASRSLRRRARSAQRPAELLDLVEGFRLGRVTIPAWQVRSELEQLLAALARERPRTVLEIGTALGGTLFCFSRVVEPDARLVTVDLPAGRFGGGYHPARKRLYERFARESQEIRPLLGDSHDRETLARVEEALGGRPVDFLFVDGDHEYEGVRTDFELYGPLVRPGGLIAFHDIVAGNPELVGGVPEFWRELKRSGETTELVESWSQEAYGIGLLRVPQLSSGSHSLGLSGARID